MAGPAVRRITAMRGALVIHAAMPDTRDARFLYIKTLRERGKFEAVWRESLRVARSIKAWAFLGARD
jgi:hypothetical protein